MKLMWRVATPMSGRCTTAPPRAPRVTLMRPSDSRMRTASRSVGRDTPKAAMSSPSDDSVSPSFSSPRTIWLRSCLATSSAALGTRKRLTPFLAAAGVVMGAAARVAIVPRRWVLTANAVARGRKPRAGCNDSPPRPMTSRRARRRAGRLPAGDVHRLGHRVGAAEAKLAASRLGAHHEHLEALGLGIDRDLGLGRVQQPQQLGMRLPEALHRLVDHQR